MTADLLAVLAAGLALGVALCLLDWQETRRSPVLTGLLIWFSIAAAGIATGALAAALVLW